MFFGVNGQKITKLWKRIENGTRFVSDIEVPAFSKLFNVSYEYLIDGES